MLTTQEGPAGQQASLQHGSGQPGGGQGRTAGRDSIEGDPEVRRARLIADAAKRQLAASLAAGDRVDVAEAQSLLDAYRDATAYAERAADQVLLHRGLLTRDEVDRRAAGRRPEAVSGAGAVPASRAAAVPSAGPGLVPAFRGGLARRVPQSRLTRCAGLLLALVLAGLGAALLARLAARLLPALTRPPTRR